VPVTFDTDGTLSGAAYTQIKSAADALIAAGAGNFVVWHRPTTKGGTDGSFGPVVSSRLRDKAAVLTSRRD
jgi:phospholipase/lecithinase/hemolysin